MERQEFWNVSGVWLFWILDVVVTVVFAVGIARNVTLWVAGWRRGNLELNPSVKSFFKNALANAKIFRRDALGGTMHMLLMWGFIVLFIGTSLLSIHFDIVHFLSGMIYLVYSAWLDVFGVFLIAGGAVALFRRYVTKAGRMDNQLSDPIIAGLMVVIGFTGFWVEGLRLAVQQPADWDWSPIGHWLGAAIGGGSQTAYNVYGGVWWTHILLAFGLVCYFPFSKLMHIFGAATNTVVSAKPPVPLTLEQREGIGAEFSRGDMIQLDACMRCNRCQNVCPANMAGEELSPREFVQAVKRYEKEKTGFRIGRATITPPKPDLDKAEACSGPDAWLCTTCRACVEECPAMIDPLNIIREVRVARVDEGRDVPPTLRDVLRAVEKHGNPWKDPASKRAQWVDGLGLKDLSGGEEAALLYWVGCTASGDSRNQEVARAFASTLQSMGVDAGTLGKEETCCGEFVRRLGEDGLFESLVEGNYATLAAYQVGSLVATSPHCFHTFSRDYPVVASQLKLHDVPGQMSVQHHTQYLAEAISSGRLKFSKRVERVATFHDPCYLGRHNGLYDVPRRVLAAIPGLRLVEMERSRSNSLCCGGGGGRMWLESTSDQRISEIRAREAAGTGADLLVTACPWCMSNLTDSAKTAGVADKLEVMDIAEVVAAAL